MDVILVVFLMIRRPPRSTLDRSSAASDVYKRQVFISLCDLDKEFAPTIAKGLTENGFTIVATGGTLSLIHISEPTRPY